MNEFKRSRIEYALNSALGSVTALIGIVMLIMAAFPWNIGLLLRGLAYIALGVGYRYLAIEKIINFKLNAIHSNLVSEKETKLNRFDVISGIFKLLGNIMFYSGMILLVLVTFKYLTSAYLDISIGLEAAGLTMASVGVLYGMNNKLDNIYSGIHDIDKEFSKIIKRENKIMKRINSLLNSLNRRVKKNRTVATR